MGELGEERMRANVCTYCTFTDVTSARVLLHRSRTIVALTGRIAIVTLISECSAASFPWPLYTWRPRLTFSNGSDHLAMSKARLGRMLVHAAATDASFACR